MGGAEGICRFCRHQRRAVTVSMASNATTGTVDRVNFVNEVTTPMAWLGEIEKLAPDISYLSQFDRQ